MRVGGALSINLNRSLRIQDWGTKRSMERLSSALRINRAADDAAGLSLSESMRVQWRGTSQAVRNAMDGLSMLGVAEGAFSTIQDVLQRMRELCVQGANGSYTLQDRQGIQAELEALKKQIDQIAYHTSFNHRSVLTPEGKQDRIIPFPYQYMLAAAPVGLWTDPTEAETLIGGPGGSFGGVSYDEFQSVLAQLPSLMEGGMRKAEGMLMNTGLDHTSFAVTPEIYFVIDNANASRFTATTQNVLVVNLAAFYGAPPPGTPQITLQQAVTQGLADLLIQREDASTAGTADYSAFFTPSGDYDNMRQLFTVGAAESYVGYGAPGAFQFDSLDVADGGRAASAWFARYLIDRHGNEALKAVTDLIVKDDTGSKANMASNLDAYLMQLTGLASRAAIEADVQAFITANPSTGPGITGAIGNVSNTNAKPLFSDLWLQVGANYGENLDLSLYAGALGNLDFAALVAVTDQDTAGRSLRSLDQALRMVSDARSKLGAEMNRLESSIRRLGSYEEGMAATESRIRDADLADEFSEKLRRDLLTRTSYRTIQNMLLSDRIQNALLMKGLA